MHSIQQGIGITWIVFWIGWLLSAFDSKRGTGGGRRFPTGGLSAIAVIVLLRVLRTGSLAVQSDVLGGIGAALFVLGLGVAVWARVNLGRNWGMPMTVKAEPELVTSGPYRFVRHPIYSGLLLGVLGTALATNLIGLAITAVLIAYFYYAATVEERNLTGIFPSGYPEYRARTTKLIPFVL
jgi:protein-S-isoprenylcysteine O-methyltransferase Ste14